MMGWWFPSVGPAKAALLSSPLSENIYFSWHEATQEMTYLADSYATYLQSQRKWKEIHEEYHKQELSVQQTADKVGFKLPHDPK